MAERRRRPLLTDQELAEAGASITRDLPLDLVDPNPSNPRDRLVEIDLLADNIKRFGLLQPVTVRRAGERYELLGGHRRRAAIALLREREPTNPAWRVIPAVVRTMDAEEGWLALLSSQLHTQRWTPREEAGALERLAETRTLPQIGALLNRGELWVGRRLRVYADAVLSGYVQSGTLSIPVAQELLVVRDAAGRRDLADRAVSEAWSAPRARAEVRKLKLSAQLADLGRRVQEMLELLSSVEPAAIPINTARDLQVLAGRISVMSRGGPTMPTIAAAEQEAGVRASQPGARRKEPVKRRPRKPKG